MFRSAPHAHATSVFTFSACCCEQKHVYKSHFLHRSRWDLKLGNGTKTHRCLQWCILNTTDKFIMHDALPVSRTSELIYKANDRDLAECVGGSPTPREGAWRDVTWPQSRRCDWSEVTLASSSSKGEFFGYMVLVLGILVYVALFHIKP